MCVCVRVWDGGTTMRRGEWIATHAQSRGHQCCEVIELRRTCMHAAVVFG